MGRIYYYFFCIQKEIVKSGALSQNTWYDYTPPGRGKWYETIFITSDFHILPKHWCWLYSLSLYFIKNSFSNQQISLYWPTDWQLKLSLKLLDRGRKIQNDVHTNTYYCKSDLISWRWINITIFNTRFPPPTDQKCADCRGIPSVTRKPH